MIHQAGGDFLSRLGFVDAESLVGGRPNMVLSLEGLEKDGKSHFYLTGPGPIGIVTGEPGRLKGVVERFIRDGKRVRVKPIDIPKMASDPEAIKRQFVPVWEAWRSGYWSLLEDKSIRTVAVDTSDDAWEVLRLARFGKLMQVMDIFYATVNQEFKQMVKQSYKCGKNVVFVTRLRKEYKKGGDGKGEWSGGYEPSGWNKMGFEVQASVRMFRVDNKRSNHNGEFGFQVMNCGTNADLKGEKFGGDSAYMPGSGHCNFKTLGMLMYPDSKEGDWE